MSSFISAAPVASGQVQSLDGLRAHALPSDAVIMASSSLVTPTNQNTGSYAIVESGVNSLGVTTTGSVPAVTQSPFADLYKEGSIYLNGVSGNYLQNTATFSNNTIQWSTAGMTVEAWVNYPTFTAAAYTNSSTTPAATQIPFTVGVMTAGGSAYWSFGSNITGYTTFYYYNNTSLQSVVAQTPISANTWNHIAMTSSTSGQIFIFINGVQSQVVANRNGTLQTASYYETVQGTPATTGAPFTVGSTLSNPTVYLADLRLTTGAPVYTGSTSSLATFTVPSAPLSSTTSPGVTQFLLRAGSNAPYVSNGSLTFDRGLKQFQNYGPMTFNIATRGFTAVFRYTWNGTALTNERIFQAFTASGSQNTSLQITRNNTLGGLRFYYSLNGSFTLGADSATNLAQGTTYIAAFVYNPSVGTGVAQWWINGAPSGTPGTGLTSSITTDMLCPFTFVGASYQNDSFGNFSSNTLAIYNRALSNAEILTATQALNTVPATPQQKTLEIGDINGTPALSVAGDGKVSVQSIGLSSNVVPWPPAAMTGYDTVINGGVYKARASSEYDSGSVAWYAFNKSTSTGWGTSVSDTYSTSSPYNYNGALNTTTVDVNGTSYTGAWYQLQLPVSIILSSYSFTINAINSAPQRFAVLGSRDGVNWSLVDSRSSGTYVSLSPTLFTIASPSTQSFNYFRVVVSACSGSALTTSAETVLYGTADASPTLTIAPATTFNTSVATPSLTGIAGSAFVPQDFSSSGLNVPAYVVSNTATVANTVQYSSFGPFAGEGSLYFGYPPTTTLNQCGAYVNLGTTTPPNFTPVGTPLTIEGWVYVMGTSADNNYYDIFVHGSPNSGAGSSYDLNSFVLNGNFYFGLGTGISPASVSASGLVYNAWNHVSGSWNGTNTIYASVNGTVVSQAVTGTPAFNSAYSFLVGAQGGAYNMRGYIACARVTRGIALYTTTFTPPTGPLQPIQGTTQAGQPYGTVLLLRNAPAPGRIQTTKFSGANSGTVLSFPPAAMTGYSTALNAGYGQGTYVASASTEYVGAANYAWYAFDKSSSTGWSCAAGYYASGTPATYTGTYTTVDVNGTSYSGEWLQIQMPSSTVLANYTIIGNTNTNNNPSRFWVFGSRDGTSWNLVDSRTGITWVSPWTQTFTVAASSAFTYYRIAVNQIQNAGGGSGVNPVIIEWTLNGSIESVNVTADGRVGLGVVNPTRALEVAGDVVCGGTLSAGNPLMFRNRVINGDFRVAQRGTSFTQAVGSSYTLDRFAIYGAQASKLSVQTSSVVPLGMGFSNSALITSLSAYTTLTGEYFGFGQLIEGFNTADFSWGTSYGVPVTVSFWVRSSVTGNYAFNLQGSGNSPSYSVQYTIVAANSWQYIVLFIPPPPSGYTGYFTTTTGLGVRLWWDLGSSDTTYATSAPGAWVAGDKVRVSGSVNFVATNGATMYITGVQLEKGTVATPYEILPYATELALCQRYYEQSYSIGTTPGTSIGPGALNIYGSSDGNNFMLFTQRYSVPKRTAVTPTFYTTTGTLGSWLYYKSGALGVSNAIAAQSQNEFSYQAFINIGAAWTANYIIGHWVANAEL